MALRLVVVLVSVCAAIAVLPPVSSAAAPTSCPGRAITPTRVITGEFGKELEKSYVMVPFDVPRGTTAVRVKYCWDRPEGPTATDRHTLDLGLYQPRRPNHRVWGTDEFRGWGGSSHPDVTVSPEGFSTEAQYTASPRIDPPGKTTRAFLPGAIKPGQWAAELGVAAVVGQADGDLDGKVAWRLEIELSDDPAFADEPYKPAPYSNRPARKQPGWYAGDFHVHAEHSAYGDATMTEAFGYAFRPLAAGGAGLDFLTLSDYVSGGAWGEVGRYQGLYPGKLIIRSAELITYRGHTNSHGTAHLVDYRTGPLYERSGDGSVQQIRAARPARELFDDVHRVGGWTQINHPTIFPPVTPAAARLCRGCFWEYSDAETQYSKVNAFELATGPARFGTAPNPFTTSAIQRYDVLRGAGYRIAAVGSSDSHNAGRTTSATQAPIGVATTVVHAQNLSTRAIECGVRAGHTYVKITGNAGPDLRFRAHPAGWRWAPAIMGDVVRAPGALFTARVLRGAGKRLDVYKDGAILQSVQVTSDDFVHRFGASAPGQYRLQLQDGQVAETVSTPIELKPGWGTVERGRC